MTVPESTAALLNTRAPLDRLELLDVSLPCRPSASGLSKRRRVLLVRWWGADGAWGIGEASGSAHARGRGSDVDAAIRLMADHLGPLLIAGGTVGDLVDACRRVPGSPAATAAVLSSALDCLRRVGIPDVVDRWAGPRRMRIPIARRVGIAPSAEDVVRRASEAIDRGYVRIKLALGPDVPDAHLISLRRAHPNVAFALDALGRFDEPHLDRLVALRSFAPDLLEQPFAPGRFDLAQRLRQLAPELRLGLDEDLSDAVALQVAHTMGLVDEANLNPARLGGPFAAAAAMRWSLDHRVAASIGGTFDTGVGRAAALRFASCLPDAVAHDLPAPSEFLVEDVVEPTLVMSGDGTIDLGDDPPPTVRWDVVDRHVSQRIEVVPLA